MAKSHLHLVRQRCQQLWQRLPLARRLTATLWRSPQLERSRLVWQWWSSTALLWGAIAFYTRVPIPLHWPIAFVGIARLAPGVGVLLGLGLASVNWLGIQLELPAITRAVGLVVLWLGITGGLHLDGVMDTADGLAVPDRERRLAVMSDSRTGAFGVMAGVSVMLLKSAALVDLDAATGLGLVLAAGWGRWAQLVAIIRFPYLKATGKGAFHQADNPSFQTAVPSLIGLIGLSLIWGWVAPTLALTAIAGSLIGFAVAVMTGGWFNHQFGGHTGDTYGAVVEWTEAIVLVLLTLF